MSQVNLLPPDILQGQRYRRVTGLVVLAGLAIIGLIILFYLLQVGRLASVNSDIDAQQATNAQLNTEITDLSKYENLQAEAQQQQQLLNDAYAGEVSYSGLMMDMSRVIPSDSFLSALSVTTPGATASTTTTPTTTTQFIGSMTSSGEAIGFDTLSQYLTEPRRRHRVGEPVDADDHRRQRHQERVPVHDQRRSEHGGRDRPRTGWGDDRWVAVAPRSSPRSVW